MLPPLKDLLASAHIVSLPMARRFRGVDVREAALLRGPEGWTEFSPFLEYDDDEASAWLAAAIDFGWNTLPRLHRQAIPVNATVPAVPADAVAAVLERFPGCLTVKVKVAERGQSLAQDEARVAAVRAELGPTGRIRIDANAAWSVEQADLAIRTLARYGLEYVEQPCASVAELAEIRSRRLGVPIAADESVRKAADPLAVARAQAADVLVIKAQPLGGITAALKIAAQAGLPVVVSSALDTSVGIAMGAYLAAAVDDLRYDCGLGTAALLAADVTDSPLVPVAGEIPVQRVEASSALLDEHAATADRTAWWLARIARCYRRLA
jgi:o-succinylbenzoate synthase